MAVLCRFRVVDGIMAWIRPSGVMRNAACVFEFIYCKKWVGCCWDKILVLFQFQEYVVLNKVSYLAHEDTKIDWG
jgi:hypothetical protein